MVKQPTEQPIPTLPELSTVSQPVMVKPQPVAPAQPVTPTEPVQTNVEFALKPEMVKQPTEQPIPTLPEQSTVSQPATMSSKAIEIEPQTVKKSDRSVSPQPAAEPMNANVESESTIQLSSVAKTPSVDVPYPRVEKAPIKTVKATSPSSLSTTPVDTEVETPVQVKPIDWTEIQGRPTQGTPEVSAKGSRSTGSMAPETTQETGSANNSSTEVSSIRSAAHRTSGIETNRDNSQIEIKDPESAISRPIPLDQGTADHEVLLRTVSDSPKVIFPTRTIEPDPLNQRVETEPITPTRVEVAGGEAALNSSSSTSTQLTVQESRVLDQVVQAVQARKTATGQEIRVRLVPDNLGEVHLKVNMTSEGVMAELSANRLATQEVLTKHAQQIQGMLVDSGLRVDQVVVKAGVMDSSPDFKGNGSPRDSFPQEQDRSNASFSHNRGSRDQWQRNQNPFEEKQLKGWETYA